MTARLRPLRRPFTWRDGDTMLAFAVFAVIVFGMLTARVADPANWLVIAGTPASADACER